MAKKKKFYVIWEGNETGVFDTWSECQLHIKGYPNARYKSFPTKEAALAAYNNDSAFDHIASGGKKAKTFVNLDDEDIVWKSIAVDAACSKNPGLMEYRGVDTKSKDEIFRQGPYKQGTNNIGEFLALVHGLAYLKKIGQPTLPIYSDSRIAIGWVKKKKVNTKLKRTRSNEKLFELIQRGVNWLDKNKFENPILKWETKKWGEIPADFGRK